LYQISLDGVELLEVFEEGGFATADVALDGQSVRPIGTIFGFALVDDFGIIHQVRGLETGLMKASLEPCGRRSVFQLPRNGENSVNRAEHC